MNHQPGPTEGEPAPSDRRESDLDGSVDIAGAAAWTWDVIVVGAGPAGAIAALRCATAGAAVLLVDKARFPREKPCGCCLNRAGQEWLRRAGVGDLPRRLGAREVDRLELAVAGRTARIPLPGTLALSRRALDAALVRAGLDAGASFLSGTRATLGAASADGERTVLLAGPGGAEPARTRTVIVADGLAGGFLGPGREGRFASAPRPGSYMGLAATLDAAPPWSPDGAIAMSSGRAGYVGLVRREDDRVALAAAIDPRAVRRAGGPAAAIALVLREAGRDPAAILETAGPWQGTPLLTRRRRRVADERLFLVGDAAGFVEPFTGEGIAWALASGSAAVACALAVARGASPAAVSTWWGRVHRRCLGPRHRACRGVTRVLRHPRLVRAVVGVLARAPGLAAPFVRSINAPTSPSLSTGGAT